jgi:hypothetical protein
MADEEEMLKESLKNHPHLTLDELREFKELFNLVCAVCVPCVCGPLLYGHKRTLSVGGCSRECPSN